MKKYVAISDARATLPGIVARVNRSNEEVIITAYGKPVAKLLPAEPDKKKKVDYKKALEESFGILPDFPDVTKYRVSRKKPIKL
jgi:prevent-host-death family protein